MPNGIQHSFDEVRRLANDPSITDSTVIKLTLATLADMAQENNKMSSERKEVDDRIIKRLDKIDDNIESLNEAVEGNPLISWGQIIKEHPGKAKAIATALIAGASSIFIKESRDAIIEFITSLLGL
jgi:hypothetical protein